MPYIDEQTKEEIGNTLRLFIRAKLEDGFTDRRNRRVEEVIEINLRDWNINDDQSDRNNLYIDNIQSLPSAWVESMGKLKLILILL